MPESDDSGPEKAPPAPAHKKNKLTKEKQAKLRMIAMLSEQGMSAAQIAEALGRANFPGISVSGVHKDLATIDARYRKEFPKTVARAKRHCLARYNRLSQMALDGFRRSQEDRVVVTETYYVTENGKEMVERKEQRQGQAGAPHFIGEARQCLDSIVTLLGLKEVKISGEVTVGEAGFDAAAARLYERISEAAAGGMNIIDAQSVEQHVEKHSGDGNGKPQLEHESSDNGQEGD